MISVFYHARAWKSLRSNKRPLSTENIWKRNTKDGSQHNPCKQNLAAWKKWFGFEPNCRKQYHRVRLAKRLSRKLKELGRAPEVQQGLHVSLNLPRIWAAVSSTIENHLKDGSSTSPQRQRCTNHSAQAVLNLEMERTVHLRYVRSDMYQQRHQNVKKNLASRHPEPEWCLSQEC